MGKANRTKYVSHLEQWSWLLVLFSDCGSSVVCGHLSSQERKVKQGLAQGIKALAAKTGHLNLIPKTHVMEEQTPTSCLLTYMCAPWYLSAVHT